MVSGAPHFLHKSRNIDSCLLQCDVGTTAMFLGVHCFRLSFCEVFVYRPGVSEVAHMLGAIRERDTAAADELLPR